MLPETYSVQNIADALYVHPVTVRRWARQGVLRGQKAGPRNHKLWFLAQDVEAFLTSLKAAPFVGRAFWKARG
jgi:hypothetical protein